MGEISRNKLIDLLVNKNESLNFSGVDFSDENLNGLDFSNTIMINTKFQRTNIGNLVLRNSKLENVKFKDSIGQPIFEQTEMINCDIAHNDLLYNGNGTTYFKKSNIKNIELWGLKEFDYEKKHTNFEFTECEILGELNCHAIDGKLKLKFKNCNLKNTFSCYEIRSLVIESCEIDVLIKGFRNENKRDYQSDVIWADVIWVADSKVKNISLHRIDGEMEFKRNTISEAIISGNINNSNFTSNTFNSTVITDSNFENLYFFNNQVLGIAFRGSKIKKSSFRENKFHESEFSTSKFDKCEFYNFKCISSKFNDIGFFDSILDHSTFTNTKFSNVGFNNSELVLCTFENATFYECDFSGIINLDRTRFKNCKFTSCIGVEKIEAGIIKKGLLTWMKGGY